MVHSEDTESRRPEDLLTELLHGEVDDERREEVLDIIRAEPGLEEKYESQQCFLEKVRRALPAVTLEVSDELHEKVMRAVTGAHVDRMQAEAEGMPEKEVPGSVHQSIMDFARQNAPAGPDEQDEADESEGGNDEGGEVIPFDRGRGGLLFFAAAAAIILAAGWLVWKLGPAGPQPDASGGSEMVAAKSEQPGDEPDIDQATPSVEDSHEAAVAKKGDGDDKKPGPSHDKTNPEQKPENNTAIAKAPKDDPPNDGAPTADQKMGPLDDAIRLEGFGGDEQALPFEHARMNDDAGQAADFEFDAGSLPRLAETPDELEQIFESGDHERAAWSAKFMLDEKSWSHTEEQLIRTYQMRSLEKIGRKEAAGAVERKLNEDFPGWKFEE